MVCACPANTKAIRPRLRLANNEAADSIT
eukprot:SAG22_NODE_17056_length_312_cov_0.967136_1_plen_28_part_01